MAFNVFTEDFLVLDLLVNKTKLESMKLKLESGKSLTFLNIWIDWFKYQLTEKLSTGFIYRIIKTKLKQEAQNEQTIPYNNNMDLKVLLA